MLASNAALAATGHKYRKELLAMPLVQFKAKLEPYVTIRYGIRGKESVGTLSTDTEIAPYNSDYNPTDDTKIALRELETFMGKVIKEFDPLVLSNTVYGNMVATKPTETDIAKAVAMEMAKQSSNKLYKAAFKAKRNAAGKTTMDLFNGWCPIIDAEIAAGEISVEKNNLVQLGDITPENTYDKLKAFYKSADEELRDIETFMYMSNDMKDAYEADYAIQFPGAAYNKTYEKTTLQGSEGRCTLVALSALAGTNTLILSTKSNMLVGVDQMSDYERVEIRRPSNPSLVQFYMVLYWGVQFESIHPSILHVGKFTTPVQGGGEGA